MWVRLGRALAALAFLLCAQSASASTAQQVVPGFDSTAGCPSTSLTPCFVPIGPGASVPINISTATTTQLVAAVSGQAIFITAWDVIAAGTGNITLEYGTGSNCGTGTTPITGPYNLTAQNGIAKGDGAGVVLVVPANNALCAVTSAATQMSGSVTYIQY